MTSYMAPTPDQVDAAMRRITKSQLRRAFFEGIENPLWVKPLAVAGAFSTPAEPVRSSEGYVRDAYWPEAEYLSRVAAQVPKQVVDALLMFGTSTNSWFRRAVFEIGAKIPAEYAAQLKPLIKSWQATGFGWRTDDRDLVSYAVNLLEGGQHEVGKWFANLIFRPSKPKNRLKPDLVLDEHWYGEGLPRITAALGTDGLELVISWLVAYERHNGHFSKDSDLSYFSRESISRGESLNGVEQVLIDTVRDLAIEAMLVDAAATKDLLLKDNMILGRKIALYSLSQALRHVTADQRRRLLAVARSLLVDSASRSETCRIDYAELARAVARTTGEPIEALTEFIESGPEGDVDRLRDWLSAGASDDAEVDERVQDHINRWKHRWLSAIGAEALPTQLQAELAELDSKHGVIEAPLAPTPHIESSWGPNSPVSHDEMATMTATELVAHLESWHTSGDRWGPEPSHEGQGRELTALLTTNPKALAGVENLINRLRPTYLRAVLQGWDAALRADLELDWAQAANLIGDVLAHSDESAVPSEGGSWHDDRDFSLAKQAATGLLKDLVKKRTSPSIPDGALAQFAETLIGSAADETAWNDYVAHDQDSGMDALTISLNRRWPIMVRGLIYLMSHGKDTAWYEAAQSALEVELARADTVGASRAVLGEGLGRLITLDSEWLTPRIPDLFGSRDELTVVQQIALTTALAVHHYHPTLYEPLAPAMIAAIDSREPIVAGWNTHTDPLQEIGEWVIQAIIRGDKTMDDPVALKFFSTAPAEMRGKAIGQIAWSFMHAEAVDDEIRDRFAELWDLRVAYVRDHPEDKEELNEFHWFVRSKRFAVEWWLPRLKEAVELDPNLSTERYMIGKELASAADVDARGAFDVLKLVLEGRDEAGGATFDLTRNAVPMVIARAIASGDAALKQDAVAYMNYLGEKGNLSLEMEVNNVLTGTITQSDVDE